LRRFDGIGRRKTQGRKEDTMAAFNKFRGNKYGNKKYFGYDSKAEAQRGAELDALERAGKIANLEKQKKYVLIPAQREPDKIGAKGGKIKGKVIEREVAYYADFVYVNEDGDTIVEDVKGMHTPEYIIKRKLMLYVHGIRVREITGGKT
jgi:hypothetical protein